MHVTIILSQVSCLHGRAQLESCKYKKQNILAMQCHGGRDGGCGGGCGQFRGRGRFGGQGSGRSGGRGGQGNIS